MQSDHAFRFVSLADAMDISGGAQPPASTFKEKLEPGYVRFVQIRDFETDAHLTYIKREDKWRYCTDEDVLIARYGASVGRVCRGVAGAYNVALVKVVPKAGEREYLYHLLRSDFFQGPIAAMSGRSAQAGFNKGDLAAIQVPLPSRAEQRRIASFLDIFERRIALLRQANATLESIAQALFKSWFIDFDPVRAKAEGREPEGMDAATAALFPAEFEESALGPTPRGWKPGCIGDLADVIDCLHSKKPELLQQGRPYLQLSNIRDDGLLDTSSLSYVSDSDYKKWTSRIEAREGDCVITNVGRVGAVAQIPTGFCAAMGRNMTAIRLRAGSAYPSFLIELLLSPWMRAEIERRTDVGTILNALNVRNIPSLKFVLPTHDVLTVAEQTLRPLRASMECNLARSAQLAKLRDTLLPRLISGKLRLAEAKEQAEDALA